MKVIESSFSGMICVDHEVIYCYKRKTNKQMRSTLNMQI